VRFRRTGRGLLAPFKARSRKNVAPLLESFAKNPQVLRLLAHAAKTAGTSNRVGSHRLRALGAFMRPTSLRQPGNHSQRKPRRRRSRALRSRPFDRIAFFEDEEAQQAYYLANSVSRRRNV
jgi:hypothetical protein